MTLVKMNSVWSTKS